MGSTIKELSFLSDWWKLFIGSLFSVLAPQAENVFYLHGSSPRIMLLQDCSNLSIELGYHILSLRFTRFEKV